MKSGARGANSDLASRFTFHACPAPKRFLKIVKNYLRIIFLYRWNAHSLFNVYGRFAPVRAAHIPS